MYPIVSSHSWHLKLPTSLNLPSTTKLTKLFIDCPLTSTSPPSSSPIPTHLDPSILEITQAFANCYRGIKRKREDTSLSDDDETSNLRPAKHLCKGFQFRRIPSTQQIALGKRKWDEYDSERDGEDGGGDDDGNGHGDEGGKRAKRVCLCLRPGGPTWATWKGLGKRK